MIDSRSSLSSRNVGGENRSVAGRLTDGCLAPLDLDGAYSSRFSATRELDLRDIAQFHFLAPRLIENVFADGEIFVGDPVGLKKNFAGPWLGSAFGDDFF